MAWPRVWPKLSRRRSPLLGGIALDDRDLGGGGGGDHGPSAAGSPASSGLESLLDPREQVGIEQRRHLHHLDQAGAQLLARQGGEDGGVGDHQLRVVEEADGVLPARQVDAGLAADRGVHLGEEGGGHLDEVDAAEEAAGGEAAEVADAAAAEGDEAAVALAAGGEHLVPQPLGRGDRLRRLAVGHRQRHLPGGARGQRVEGRTVEGGEAGRREEEDGAAGGPAGEVRPRLGERPGADEDRRRAAPASGTSGAVEPVPEGEMGDRAQEPSAGSSPGASPRCSPSTAIPSSASCRGSTPEGASVIRSVAEVVFGKAMTSRIEAAPASSMTSRSRPRAMPPCGGAP